MPNIFNISNNPIYHLTIHVYILYELCSVFIRIVNYLFSIIWSLEEVFVRYFIFNFVFLCSEHIYV